MKTVLITGVLGGMGKATAKMLLEQNYNVIGFDVLDKTDLPITYYKVDLTKSQEIEKAYNEISKNVSSIYAIIHFAGIYKMDSLVEMGEKEFLSIFDVNAFSVYRINKTFLPLLEKGSKIVITTSELAPLDPLPFTGIYAITKATLEKYAYSLKMELQLLDISVSVIRSGAVNTGILSDSIKSIEGFKEKTILYKENANKFSKIVNSVESKNVQPVKIAKVVSKILNGNSKKVVYNVNRNFLLLLLNAMPKRLQLFIIRKLLKNKKG
jgi:short-subunit dehydrogenase